MSVKNALLLASVCFASTAGFAAPALWEEFPTRTAEPILFMQAEGGLPEGNLLFQPKRLLRAYAFNPDREFPVSDFTINECKVVYVGTEKIPHWTEGELVSSTKTNDHGQPHADEKRFIVYGGSSLFADRQIHFDYETDETWSGPIPIGQSENLPRLSLKIKNRQPIKVTILGDSISQGCDSTAWSNVPPQLPPFRDMIVRAIRQASRQNVSLHNLAVGGKTAEWGTGQVKAVAETKPDLLIIAFGMNDSSGRRAAGDFIGDIKTIMDGVRAESPETEFLLVSGMTPIPQWAHSHLDYLEAYHRGLEKLAGPHVAVGDVRTVWLYMLGRKNYFDLSGNGINHPNDYGHRLYGDVLAQTVLGGRLKSEKGASK